MGTKQIIFWLSNLRVVSNKTRKSVEGQPPACQYMEGGSYVVDGGSRVNKFGQVYVLGGGDGVMHHG